MPQNPTKYRATAIAFHWVIATCVFLVVALALYLESLDLGATKNQVLALHKSIGILIFALTWGRLAWRVTHRPPALPEHMTTVQRLAAAATHISLYGLTIAMPISGYLSVAARGRETSFFGLFAIPQWAPLDRALANLSETAHTFGQYAVYGLVALHVAAALYHQFIKRDGLLQRMWPR